MRQIFRKRGDQHARCRQISQRQPLECSARRPRCRCFPDDPRCDSLFLPFKAARTLVASRRLHFRAPGERCLIFSTVLSLHVVHSRLTWPYHLHPAIAACIFFFSAMSLFTALVPTGSGCLRLMFSLSSQFRIGQPCVRAMLARSLAGFTAVGRPTTSINQRSFKLSP